MPEGYIDRPMSPSVPRDCGHECRVCGVKVKGLTDYADHISSPVHKQCVEAHERQTRASDQEEEYFDKELVQLIEKRRELIRYRSSLILCPAVGYDLWHAFFLTVLYFLYPLFCIIYHFLFLSLFC